MESSVITDKIELQSCMDELNFLKREFEVCKMELNYQRARRQRIEAFVRRDTRENKSLAHNWSANNISKNPNQVTISNLQHIYEGEWQ